MVSDPQNRFRDCVRPATLAVVLRNASGCDALKTVGRGIHKLKMQRVTCSKKNVAFSIFAKTRRRFGNGHSMLRTVALWKPRSARSAGVRHEVRADVRVQMYACIVSP